MCSLPSMVLAQPATRVKWFSIDSPRRMALTIFLKSSQGCSWASRELIADLDNLRRYGLPVLPGDTEDGHALAPLDVHVDVWVHVSFLEWTYLATWRTN